MSKKNIVNLMCLDLYFQLPRDASVIVQSEDKVSWQSFSTSWITFYGSVILLGMDLTVKFTNAEGYERKWHRPLII